MIYQGDELTIVGDYQFYTSDGIHSLVNYIGNDTEIVLPDSYNGENYKIGDYAFYGCSSLTAITIPEGVTSIGDYAFDNCTALKKVIIEDGSSTLSLGYNGSSQGLFYECPLEEVYLGRNLSYSSGSYSSPFYNKDALTNVTIGNEVTQISEYAFYGCDNIHSLTIPSGVLSIGSNAFSTPEKVIWLTNTPPTGYTNAKGSINYAANDQHSSLSKVKVYPYLSSMFEVDGVKYVPVSPSERTCHAIDCAYDSTAMVINLGETAIYKRVEMKVTEVMPYTFYGNEHIKEVSVSHLGNLGDYAFYDCDAIETAIVANEGAVGDQAFSGCSSLNAVTLGDSIGSLGYQAFYQCSSLQEIVIPDSVKSVGQYCFSGCTAMKSATIGDGVTAINNYAFQYCSSLPEITLPQAVTKVGDYVFVGCSKLADVVIADRTTALALGSNGSSALFADCPLDSVYIGGKITYNTTSSYGYSPFYRNTSLRTVVITDREEQIYDNEFYGCTNLQDVTIGNGVKSIGNYAFSGCSSLAGFSFGSNMETIGAEAFSDCTSLTSITSHAAVPPTCGAQALDDINKWSCTLRVPSGYAAAYQTADQWKEFFFVEDVVEVAKYKLTFMIDGEVYYTDSLVHKAEVTVPEVPEREGYTFSGWSEVPETMPAEDVTISGFFTVNKYLVTFVIDDEVIASDSLEYGASIVAPIAPEKEGHTFNGWGEVAETVPAEDVTYYGSYSVNSYLLTYVVDGETVQSDSVAYGSTIVALEEPTKEGHTFSGWSEIPETMPAEDVTISGFFTVNMYKVYYYVGDELVHTAEVPYGEAIPEYVYEPTAEGDVFVGWVGETYETMPAHDVTYTANIESGIDVSILDPRQTVIYDLNGRKILVDDLRELERGVYIIDNKKVVIK